MIMILTIRLMLTSIMMILILMWESLSRYCSHHRGYILIIIHRGISHGGLTTTRKSFDVQYDLAPKKPLSTHGNLTVNIMKIQKITNKFFKI